MPKIVGLLDRRDFYWSDRYHVDYRPGGHGDDRNDLHFTDADTLIATQTTGQKESFRVMIPGFIIFAADGELCRDLLLNSFLTISIDGQDVFLCPADVLYAIGSFDVGRREAQAFTEKDDAMAGLAVLAKTAWAMQHEIQADRGVMGWTRLGRTLVIRERSTLGVEFKVDGRARHLLAEAERTKSPDWFCSIRLFALGQKRVNIK
jgi:hypothetical protein